MAQDSKLCLDCALRKLSGKRAENCTKCLLLNIDPMAQIRANYAKKMPLQRFMTDGTLEQQFFNVEESQKPARATPPRRYS